MTEPRGARERLLAEVADAVLRLESPGVTRVGIDGVDGAGKTVFADELAEALRQRGATVIRASVDGFHHPAAVRHRRGRSSPEGFYLDSYDYERLRRLLLDPLGPGGTRRYVREIHDVHHEREVAPRFEVAAKGSILVLDGIFLHRPELVDAWDHSVFLRVRPEVAVPRGASRGYGDPDPHSPANRRYVEGQRLYLSRCRPEARASVVIDNHDLDAPYVVTPVEGG